MADRVSQRRQAANSFYLSINTLLLGGSAYLGGTPRQTQGVLVITVAGIAICSLWVWNILSYKTLNAAKFAVIQEVEKSLTIQPYTDEWARLDPEQDGERHTPFHRVEMLVPWVFLTAYVVQGAIALYKMICS
jgi:hypothetical protein